MCVDDTAGEQQNESVMEKMLLIIIAIVKLLVCITAKILPCVTDQRDSNICNYFSVKDSA